MKVGGSKAISSPSRGAENYQPPPLIMRFLRSKSRGGGGRSRSSPMFVVGKKNLAATIETQEPSSPKVTCIGQVRVGRSSQPQPTCFPLTKCSTPRIKPNCRKLASFFGFGCCIKGDEDVSNKSDSNKMNHFNVDETEVSGIGGEKEEEEEEEEEVSRGSTTPPKNALLLTRCRSAPFRSSSLAVQFWGEKGIGGDQVNNTSCYAFDRRESKQQFRHDEQEISAAPTGKQRADEIISMPHPLILTRCRSQSQPPKTIHG